MTGESRTATGASRPATWESRPATSEQTAHVALERGIAFIGAGHHATERYGVQAVGSLAAEALGLSHEFIDIDNPA